MTHSVSEATRLTHASLALFSISRILRQNLDFIDLADGCRLSVRDQHGLLLAAENIAEQLYASLEHQEVNQQGRESGEAHE